VADAEAIEVTEDDLDEQVETLAERVGRKPAEVRRQLERTDQLQAIRSDVRKSKALEWLVDHVELVDEEGHPVDRADLQATPDTDDDDAAADADASTESTESGESGEASA
jgi:trigger factor